MVDSFAFVCRSSFELNRAQQSQLTCAYRLYMYVLCKLYLLINCQLLLLLILNNCSNLIQTIITRGKWVVRVIAS